MKIDAENTAGGWTMEGYRLSSGRFFNPNRRIVGINPDLEIFGGYDSPVYMEPDPNVSPGEISDLGWTPEEKSELADYMIALWGAFREKTLAKKAEVGDEGPGPVSQQIYVAPVATPFPARDEDPPAPWVKVTDFSGPVRTGGK
jgi:hypothetical protein